MLRIRLNDRSRSDGTATIPDGSENVTVACPDHLVLAELPVAKGLGNVSGVKVVKTVGRRSRRQPGEKVHICVRCNFPIAIYGRLSPCSHAFCLTCARSDSNCYLCDERIQKIQTVKMLDGIFMCAAPHCLKSFLKRTDFELHIKETHPDLLQPLVGKRDRHQKDVVNPKPVTSDSQSKQLLHAQPQSLQSQPKSVPLPSGTSQHVEKHSQQYQFMASSSGTKQQHQEEHLNQQTQQAQIGFQQLSPQQHAFHGNTGASSPQQYQEKQQGLEQKSDQSHRGEHHGQSHGERHHSELGKHHQQDIDQHHQQQQQGKPQNEESHQGNPAKQALWGNQPMRPQIQGFTNQSEIPTSFTTQSLQYPYPMQPEGQPQQQFTSNYDPTRYGPLMPVQTTFQSFQQNNPRMPLWPSTIPDFQENYPRQGYAGPFGVPHDAMTAIPGPQGGYIPPQQQRAFQDFQNNCGQGPIGMPRPLQPEGAGMALNQSPHHQNVPHDPHIAPPPPKRGQFQNIPDQGDIRPNVQNNQWSGGVPNFHPGHGYGGWSGTQ